MVKKISRISFIIALIFGAISVTLEDVKAQEVLISIGDGDEIKGSTQTRRETLRCSSGIEFWCAGVGNLCTRTQGVVCELEQ